MKLTDPEVIEHLKENYYIRRKCWTKDTGYYYNGRSIVFICGPFIHGGQGFSFEDIQADDWVLRPTSDNPFMAILFNGYI